MTQIINKRARQYLIKKINAPDTEGNFRTENTYSFQFPPTFDGENHFLTALTQLDMLAQIATIKHQGFHDTHFQIDIEWKI